MSYHISEIPLKYRKAAKAKAGSEEDPQPLSYKKLQRPPSAFRVSDNHSQTTRGEHARYCVRNSLYVVYLTGNGEKILCQSGKEHSISKNRLNQTKDIQAGDILFMGDTVAKKIYRGEVLKRHMPYKAGESKFSAAREIRKNIRTKTPDDEEIELLFEVRWKEVDSEALWDKLATSRRITVFPMH
jgi:hypothetical protein